MLMAYKGLVAGAIPIPLGLGRINDAPHLRLLLLSQIDISRRPILLQTRRLRRAWNGNEPLSRDPRQRYLRKRAALANSQLLDLFHDGLVFVEVLALEFWRCGTC